MKEIPLSTRKNSKHNGKYVAIVDYEDYDALMKWSWSALIIRGKVYAARGESKGGINKMILMHRQISGATLKSEITDHHDNDTLNNQRYNLRICDCAKNAANRTSAKNSTSKYLGVYWDKSRNLWVARITKFRLDKRLGRFKKEEDAARAYDSAAMFLHGDYANLNFK